MQILAKPVEPLLEVTQNIERDENKPSILPLTVRDQIVETRADGQYGRQFLVYIKHNASG